MAGKTLKDLLSRAKGLEQKSFGSIDFNLNFQHYTDDQIRARLQEMVDMLDYNGAIHKEDRNRLVLECFRLAFSKEPRKGGAFHPSEIAVENPICDRKLYFQYGNVEHDKGFAREAVTNNGLQRIFDIGTFLHLYIQSNLDYAGVLEDFEVPVSSPENGIEGAGDGITVGLYNKRLGLEIKSINDFGFKSLRGVKPEHLKQASIYFSLLGITEILFVYYNKNTSEFKEYVVPVDDRYVEDFKRLAQGIIKMYNSQSRINRTADATLHTLPARLCCGKRTDKRALGCAYGDTCFRLV
jgi:hypothetical protein